MKRLVVKVAGRVQGVLFRHSARTHAEKLGLTGFVKNEPDGSVAIVAEGEDAALNEFLEWCRRGPPLARVDEVTVEWREAARGFTQFETRR